MNANVSVIQYTNEPRKLLKQTFYLNKLHRNKHPYVTSNSYLNQHYFF